MGAPRPALAQRMIRVNLKSKQFGEVEILRNVDFEIAPGETLALLGPSGIGKSTILRILAGIDSDFEGEIERPDDMAVVFQEPTLLPWRSVLDNLILINRDLTRQNAIQALDRVGLGAKVSDFPGQLSLGQQRRLSLARAFAGRPELLIMDEPFVSLDPETAEQMLSLTEDLIAETAPAVLFVTHSKTEADRLAHRTLTLAGSPATLTG